MPTKRATGPNPTYHATLTDGTLTVGIIAAAGAKATASAIRRFPRGPGVERKSAKQQTWVGGRGSLRFATDLSRFSDSGWANTLVADSLISGPQWHYATGLRSAYQSLPSATFVWHEMYAGGSFLGAKYLARSFVPDSSFTAARAALWLERIGSPGTLTVEICSNNAGVPGTVLQTLTVTTATITDTLLRIYPFLVSGGQALTSGTTYWLKVYDTAGTLADHWRVGCVASGGFNSTNGTSWSAAPALNYRLDASGYDTEQGGHFFEYQRALYLATSPDAGTAGKVYRNGYQGVVTGAGQTTLLIKDTTQTWTLNELAGCTIVFTAGPNKGLSRRIASNTTGGSIVPTKALPVACTAATTEYVILGCKSWVLLGSTGITGPVTGVTVAKGAVYLAQGDSINIRRMRAYNNAGVFTREWADDASNKATFLTTFTEVGEVRVYRANNSDVTFSYAPAPATWGTDLVFSTAEPAGDSGSNITYLTIYNTAVHLGKEDALGLVKDGKWAEIDVPIRFGRDENNCNPLRGWNTYLDFPYMSGLERLYGTIIDDIGPNRDQGLPSDRRGRVSDFRPVHQYAYVCIDAGDGYSSILMTTSPGGDWHEIYRAPEADRRIRSMYYQSVPSGVNLLWYLEGGDVGCVLRERDTASPLNDSYMAYSPEGYVVSAWIDLDTPELDHYWDEMRLFSKQLGDDYTGFVRMDYQVDNDAAWTPAPVGGWYTFTTSPYQRQNIGNGLVTGRRFRYRLVFSSAVLTSPIVISALEVRANTMNEVLYDFILDFLTEDRLQLLTGEDTTEQATSVFAVLAGWQEDATPLTFTSVLGSPFTAISCHIDPVALVPRSWESRATKWSGSLTLKQT